MPSFRAVSLSNLTGQRVPNPPRFEELLRNVEEQITTAVATPGIPALPPASQEPVPVIGFPSEVFGPRDAERLELQNFQFENLDAQFRTDNDRTDGSNLATERLIDVLNSDDPRREEFALGLIREQGLNRQRYIELLRLRDDGIGRNTARDLLDEAGVSGGGFDEAGRDERLRRLREAIGIIENRTIEEETGLPFRREDRVEQAAATAETTARRQALEDDFNSLFEIETTTSGIPLERARALGVAPQGEQVTTSPGPVNDRRITSEQDLATYVAYQLQDEDGLDEDAIQERILDDAFAVMALARNDIFGAFSEGDETSDRVTQLITIIDTKDERVTRQMKLDAGRDLKRIVAGQAGIISGRVKRILEDL